LATVKVTRDTGYADALRVYRVMIDGNEAGVRRPGETGLFPASGGTHEICLKIDWCGSKTVSFNVGQQGEVYFLAKSNLRGWRILSTVRYVFFERDSYLLLEGPFPEQPPKSVGN
jgi:hypothetical protein